MGRLGAYARTVWMLLRYRTLATLWVNFKMLPFRQAWHLPILVRDKVDFRSLEGEIVIDAPSVYPFMIRIGSPGRYVYTSRPMSVWKILGKVVFRGSVTFVGGTYLCVAPKGVLTFGDDSLVGSDSRIICFDRITMGYRTRITWFCQVYDSSFHYVKDEMGEVAELSSPVEIGENVWIGNNVTVARGAVIPSWSVVCSHSLVNKDMSDSGEHCMFAGVPAKKKRGGVTRVFDIEEEERLDALLGFVRVKGGVL